MGIEKGESFKNEDSPDVTYRLQSFVLIRRRKFLSIEPCRKVIAFLQTVIASEVEH